MPNKKAKLAKRRRYEDDSEVEVTEKPLPPSDAAPPLQPTPVPEKPVEIAVTVEGGERLVFSEHQQIETPTGWVEACRVQIGHMMPTPAGYKRVIDVGFV
jgi:hypothetical protein